MVKKKKKKSTGRFGPRYGSRLKDKFAEIETRQKKLYKCPLCSKEKVKRLHVGLWYCTKCKTKFAGKAYSLS